MTPNEVECATFLMQAKKGIAKMRKAAKCAKPDPHSGDYRGVEISVGDYDESGGTSDAWAYFDLRVGGELIDFAEGLIDRELNALGIKFDEVSP